MFARCQSLLFCLLMATPVCSEPTPPAAPPKPPDFAAGFTRLAALGLPPLDSHAQWTTFPEGSLGGGSGYDYQLREFIKSLKGNGWNLPSPNGKPLCLPAGSLDPVEANPGANRNPPRGLLGAIFGGGGGGKSTTAPPAVDLAKDVATLIAALGKAKSDPEFSFRSSTSSIPGRLLVLAAQIHQNGHPGLANDLAIAVFDFCGSSESAVDAAVSLIADHAYEAAAQAFFASGDWVAYHRSLTELIAKFPRGWASRDAVAILIPQLAKQAAGDPPATPSLPGITLDPKALDAIHQLTAKPNPENPAADDEKLAKLEGLDLASLTPQMRMQILASLRQQGMTRFNSSSSWLLESPGKQEKSTSPLAKLTALGIDALPALAALVDDPYLTSQPNENSRGGYSYFSPNEGDAERTMQLYASLNRPATRGELACMLLKATLPDTSRELNEADPEALRELALAFWKSNQHATRDELAIVFLRDGSSYQIQSAATLLTASTDPKAHQAFEAHILAADPAINQFQSVRTYLTARKAAAKPFFDAYAKLVRSQTTDTTEDDNSNEFFYAIKEAGGPEKILKQLTNLVGGKSPRAIAKEIAKAKPADAESAIRALLSQMENDTRLQQLYTLLEGANATEDPIIRCSFLQATYSIRRKADANEEQSTDGKAKPATDRTLPEAEIKVWQKLVADTRELPESFGEKAPIGDFAAAVLEYSVNPEMSRMAYLAAPVLQKTQPEFFRERATARLAGKPIPPLPDATRVTPVRLRAIVAAAGTKPAPEIHPYLKTLTPDERAAWLEWTTKPGDIPIPQSVKDLRLLVISRENDIRGYPGTQDTGALGVGFMVSPENLNQWVGEIAADVTKHSRTVINLFPAKFGPGLNIVAYVVPLPAKNPNSENNVSEAADIMHLADAHSYFRETIKALDKLDAAEAIVTSTFSSKQTHKVEASWLIAKKQAKPASSDEQAKFDAAMKDFAASSEFERFVIKFNILKKTDADKIKASSEESNPEESDPP